MEPITGLFSINAAFPHLRVQPNEHQTKVRPNFLFSPILVLQPNEHWTKVRLNFLFSPILVPQPNEHRTQRTKVRFNFFCTDSKLYALSVGDLVGLLQKVNQSWPSESLPWLILELYGPASTPTTISVVTAINASICFFWGRRHSSAAQNWWIPVD